MQGRNEKCKCGSGKKYKKCCGENVSKCAVGTRRFATKQDYLGNIDVVLEVWETYKKMYAEEVQKRGGLFTVDMMNKLVLKAKSEVGTTEEQEVAIEGLFDSYVAQMTIMKDSSLVQSNVDRQLSAILEERDMRELGFDIEIDLI